MTQNLQKATGGGNKMVITDTFIEAQKPATGRRRPIFIDPNLLAGQQNPTAKAKKLLRPMPDATFCGLEPGEKSPTIIFNGHEAHIIRTEDGQIAIVPWHSC